MRVRFCKSLVSPVWSWSYQPGQIVEAGTEWTVGEIPLATARAFLESGTVEAVDDDPMEAATLRSVATTALRPRRTKRAE